jgi:hypothetical protein
MVADQSSILCDESHLHFFFTGESLFLLTSQVILSIGEVPYPMELPPYPIDSYPLVDVYELVDTYELVFIA